MTADDRAAWIMAAADALQDIRAEEVAAVSAEVRRLVTRAAQIVPEISRMVAELRKRRAEQSRIEFERNRPVLAIKHHVMDRDRRNFGPEDWRELNEHLEKMGSTVRYHDDGTRQEAAA